MDYEIGTRFFWDNLEYELEKRKWQDQGKSKDSSISSSGDTAACESVPLSSFRKVETDLEEGYVTERRAGKYMERRIVNLRQEGGSLIRKLPHDSLDGEEVRPYVLNRDIIPADQMTDAMLADSRFVPIDDGFNFIEYRALKFMRHNTSRMANPRQVRKTCDNFKWLVRANEDRVRLFVTLTYACNMTDTRTLYNDFRCFWQRLRRAVPKVDGYLVAFEPQRRGAWHAHVLLLSDFSLLYISNKHMRALWGHGFTKTQRPKGIKDVACYLTSYLTNVIRGKSTKKGARLGMYPSGFRFCRSSRTNVRRTSVRRWFGPWNRLHRCDAWRLLYDYQNVRRVSRDGNLYQVSKILCLEDTSGYIYDGGG